MIALGQVLIGGYSLVHVAIILVVIAAVCALVWIALQQFGIAIPAWVIQVMWVLIVSLVIILAIKIVSGFV